jgi:hypothetical protein
LSAAFNIPEDLNPQQHLCESLQSHIPETAGGTVFLAQKVASSLIVTTSENLLLIYGIVETQ